MASEVERVVVGLIFATLCSCSAPPQPAEPTEMKYHEQAAIIMLRLGFDRWQVACAYQVGKSGGSQNQAEKQCRIDWHLEKGRPPAAHGASHD